MIAYNITPDEMFLNIESIHPMAQKDVAMIVKECRDIPTAKLIAIFGSATRKDYIRDKSDINVYVHGTDYKEVSAMRHRMFGRVTFYTDDMFLDEFHGGAPTTLSKLIANEGVIVYTRDKLGYKNEFSKPVGLYQTLRCIGYI